MTVLSTSPRHEAQQHLADLQAGVYKDWAARLARSALEPYDPGLQAAALKVQEAATAYDKAAQDFGAIDVSIRKHLAARDKTDDIDMIVELTEQIQRGLQLAEAQAIICERRGRAVESAATDYRRASGRAAKQEALVGRYRADAAERIAAGNARYKQALDELADATHDLRGEIMALARVVKKSDPSAASFIEATITDLPGTSGGLAAMRRAASATRPAVVLAPWDEPRGAYSDIYGVVTTHDQHGRPIESIPAGRYGNG